MNRNPRETDETPNLLEALIGSFRQIGELGPIYEVLGPGESFEGRSFARILLLESGEETTYPVADILQDPEPA